MREIREMTNKDTTYMHICMFGLELKCYQQATESIKQYYCIAEEQRATSNQTKTKNSLIID